MKRRLSFCFFLALVLASLSFSCKKESYDIYTSIDGFVYDEANNEPLNGVTVTITPGGKSMVTGSDGYFEFTSLDPQQYSMSAQKTGYMSNRRTVTGVAGEAVHVTFTLTKNN